MTRNIQLATYNEKYWQDLQDEFRSRISLPDIFEQTTSAAFAQALKALDAARETLQQATTVRDLIAKLPDVDPQILAPAEEAVKKAAASLAETDQTALQAARPVIIDLQQNGFLSGDPENCPSFYGWLVWNCISQATPDYLGKYCEENGPDHAEALAELFRQPQRLVHFVQHGLPAHAHFGEALDIYTTLSASRMSLCPLNEDTDGRDEAAVVLDRLAMAVALELSAPLDHAVVHSDAPQVDPIQRFLHYRRAYLMGELDPNFSRLTIWELRMVIDSDAKNDELGWGRESLKNHRPDLVLMDDEQWRYCRIVRTDVDYRDPVFYKDPPSYDQILSGGGKCGPRAWYGRFACKAFGVPTWGVTQPGHAAMSRWTPHGWIICLGAGFEVSFWLDRCGNDFLLETQARNVLGTDERYMAEVNRLEWAALFAGEKQGLANMRHKGDPESKYLWTALGYYQRRLWAVMESATTGTLSVDLFNQITRLDNAEMIPESIRKEPNKLGDNIIIPAEAFTDHAGSSCLIMKSFLGGNQLWLGPSSEVSYEFDSTIFASEKTRYKAYLYLNTIHRDEPPLLMSVSELGVDEDSPLMVSMISIDYTMGIWEETQPVDIEFGGSDTDIVKLTLSRQANKFGIAIKYIKLVPIPV